MYYVVGNHDIVLEQALHTWVADYPYAVPQWRSGNLSVRIEHGHTYDAFYVASPRLRDPGNGCHPFLHLYPDIYRLWSATARLGFAPAAISDTEVRERRAGRRRHDRQPGSTSWSSATRIVRNESRSPRLSTSTQELAATRRSCRSPTTPQRCSNGMSQDRFSSPQLRAPAVTRFEAFDGVRNEYVAHASGGVLVQPGETSHSIRRNVRRHPSGQQRSDRVTPRHALPPELASASSEPVTQGLGSVE